MPPLIMGHELTGSAAVRLAGKLDWCPRPESNQRTRFRKPLLYPLSYGGPGIGGEV